jgi:hypothetical protein
MNTEGREKFYTPSPRGPIKTYVTVVGLLLAGLLVQLLCIAIVIAVSPGRLE